MNVSNIRDGPISPDHFGTATQGLKYAVETYSERHFTRETDALKAFEGIAAYYSGILYTTITCGLPRHYISFSLCWQLRPRLHHQESAARRVGFPSWSWVGWRLPVRMPVLEQSIHSWLSAKIRNIETLTMSGTGNMDSSESSIRCLQLNSVILRLKLGGPYSPSVAANAECFGYNIIDRNGRTCGRIQLMSEWLSSFNSIQEFILVKDSRYGEEYASEPNLNRCTAYNEPLASDYNPADLDVLQTIQGADMTRPYYIVMMVRTAQGSFVLKDARERVGIGILYKRAAYRSINDELSMIEIEII